jgi:hypothetical protein
MMEPWCWADFSLERVEGLAKVARDLPFAMLGVDTDNDSSFMTQTLFDYCKGLGLEQTRSRAYKKNDQAWSSRRMAPSCGAWWATDG